MVSAVPFDAQAFLDSAGVARAIVEYKRKQTIFSQGDICKSVMYIQKGGVKLSVVSKVGREAVVAILGPGDFVGEGSLAGQPLRMATAKAVTPSTLLVIDKKEMFRVLHAEHALADRFITYMCCSAISAPKRTLIDQLFNSSENVWPAHCFACYGKEDKTLRVIPRISQETLAEMIGTTRSRVNFMNRFRKMGFIKYNGTLQVNNSLLSIVLHD